MPRIKKSAFVIREIEGRCTVTLYDNMGLVLLHEDIEDQDPYEYIGHLRMTADEAEILERPRLNLRESEPNHVTIDFVKRQMAEMEDTIKALRTHIEQLEYKETSFTEGL